MSFSQKVKEEAAGIDVKSRHCRMAELAAFYAFCVRPQADDAAEPDAVRFCTESALVQTRVFTLLRKTFKITSGRIIEKNACGGEPAGVCIYDPGEACKVQKELSIRDADDLSGRICSRNCCIRAFLRGAFLTAGSVSDPEKSYHFEIICPDAHLAEQVSALIRVFRIDARIIRRKGRHVVYVKEGTQIADLLNIIGAHSSLMQMENIRIVKDVRNRINRQVNCETANLTKTVNASLREAEEIRQLEEAGILQYLSEPLQETAALRMEHPEASLRELGEMHDPPIGRSGVNHRLKKISEIASNAAAFRVGSEEGLQQVSGVMEET